MGSRATTGVNIPSNVTSFSPVAVAFAAPRTAEATDAFEEDSDVTVVTYGLDPVTEVATLGLGKEFGLEVEEADPAPRERTDNVGFVNMGGI